MNESAISVIIPTYNRAHLLEPAIDSALGQTLPPIEVVVVDDCSTDDTRERLLRWQDRDPRIRPVFQDVNQGPSGARNRGVLEARGEVVAFLDSDDRWRPTHLERGAALLAACPDIDVVFADIRRVGADGVPFEESMLWERRHIERHLTPIPELPAPGGFRFRVPEREVLLREYLVPMQTMILRRRAALAVPFDLSFRVAEDYDFTLRLARSGARFGFTREVQCDFVIHDSNLVSNDQTGLRYASNQGRVWMRLLVDPKSTPVERHLLRKRIAKWRVDEGYTYMSRGNRRQARGSYVRSFMSWPSWVALRGVAVSTLIPRRPWVGPQTSHY
jgi:glycosyltransferase involved in cell wall biosynthesis